MPYRVFLRHTFDLGKDTEPGSFVAATVEAMLRAHAATDMVYSLLATHRRLVPAGDRGARALVALIRSEGAEGDPMGLV